MRRVSVMIVLTLLAAGCAAAQEASSLAYEDPEALAQLITTQSEPYLLLDVRTSAEYRQGHIMTAISAPVAGIIADGLDVPKDTLIIVYCASGARSNMAAKALGEQGFTRVVDFGSIKRWSGELQTGDPVP